MTTARQQRKSPAAFVAAIVLLFGGNIQPSQGQDPADNRMVVDRQSGLAISGFDPVAYFTDGKALPGRADLELTVSGTVWRFRNEGNRAAFSEHPEVYTPRFGGYDPVAIVRGSSVPGHPLIWAIATERLYLFYNDKARAAFLADPGRIIESATRKWPAVARTIAR